MTKILACVPMAFDATSYYRSYGVFPNLKKQVPNLFIDGYGGWNRKYTWAELMPYDILFMQRPAHPDWLALAKYCKNLGMKIWVDHDDNLFELPPYNRVVDTYDEKVKRVMWDLMSLADVVTVSTPAIQKYFEGLNIKSVVIPNALNDLINPMVESYNQTEGIQQIVWRGSETHQADLYAVQLQVREAITIRPSTLWSFIGFNPWHITMDQHESKWQYVKQEDIMIYYDKLKALKPQLMHVPLIMDGLNICKSNIAWIEATAAGAVTLGPDWPEWQRPGIIHYRDLEEYQKLLIDPFDEEKMKVNWEASRDYINENLLLTHVNKQRVEILNELTK